MPFDERFKILARGVPIIRKLLCGERVDGAYLAPWPDTAGGPPILIGSWHSGLWVRRAAKEYDGWIASGYFTSFRQLRDGIQRYRDAGGTRALVSTITVNLHAPNAPFDEDARFHLECAPAEAAELYLPLMQGTLANLSLGAAQALTGPVRRGDAAWHIDARGRGSTGG